MLPYTAAMVLLGTLVGYYFPGAKGLSAYILPVVFIMIYPMMVNISISALKSVKKSVKPLIEGLLLNFVIAPILIYILAPLFISDPLLIIALLLLAVAPASSMGLGYLGLAEGDMITGALIVATAFILSIFVYPIAGVIFLAGTTLSVPISTMIQNLLIILVLPLILGITTREYIERNHGREKFLKVKPYFSTTTLTFLYVLLFLIFASKATLIIKNYIDILLIAPVAILFYGIMIFFTILLNKNLLGLEYEHHQALVFTSIGKNVALTIAILVSVFGQEGQYMAVAPAIVSLFQAPILMLYLKYSDKIRDMFQKIEEEIEEEIKEIEKEV